MLEMELGDAYLFLADEKAEEVLEGE